MYLLRLDDAAERWDKDKWQRMHDLLKEYDIKPIVAIIPNVEDSKIMQYPIDEEFDNTMHMWISEGWTPALHGYNHVLKPSEGGLNPVNSRSEFVGLTLDKQSAKIAKGYEILCKKGFNPKIFVAPAHTFDNFTLTALKENTHIRIISDTIANDIYYSDDFFFIPQQSGRAREMKFKITTFCYHPNTSSDVDFDELRSFIEIHNDEFTSFDALIMNKRSKSLYDKLLSFAYFTKRRLYHK